ncbi:MAG: nucleotidyltransferase family protein [Planctomycetota bacterium]
MRAIGLCNDELSTPAARSFQRLGRDVAVACRNALMMRLLERFAERCAARGVEVMALKGAALLATVYRRPGDRPMRDLDVLVRPADLSIAVEVLREMHGQPLEPWVTPDFCPRYYNELEYKLGDLEPVLIEPHVRPFRPLRLQCTVPDEAWWDDSCAMSIGRATLRRPSDEHMLMHLAAHVAMHGGCSDRWREDITRWLDATGGTLDWDRFVDDARAWRLAPAVVRGIDLAGLADRLPAQAWRGLTQAPCNWRDRLMLRWAPGDHASPLKHLLGALLTTPDLRRAIGFAAAITFPNREHMARWYPHRHPGWLAAAHAWRVVRPVLRPLTRLSPWKPAVEVMADDSGQPPALCANCPITPGTPIATLPADADDVTALPGPLAHLGVSDMPTVRVVGRKLVALRQLRYGDPVTVSLAA